LAFVGFQLPDRSELAVARMEYERS